MCLPLKRKLQNITSKAYSVAAIVVLLLVWQILSSTGIVPSFLLPSPVEVVRAFVKDFPLLMGHAKVTLLEGFLGLALGVIIGFAVAALMDRFQGFYKAFYPIMVITQTIPTIAIAPLLVLWMGYEMAPKVTLIVIVTFFPIAIGLLEGFQSADSDGSESASDFFTCKISKFSRKIFCKSSDFGVLLCGRGCNLRVAWRI